MPRPTRACSGRVRGRLQPSAAWMAGEEALRQQAASARLSVVSMIERGEQPREARRVEKPVSQIKSHALCADVLPYFRASSVYSGKVRDEGPPGA